METQKLFAGVPDEKNWAVGPCFTDERAREVIKAADDIHFAIVGEPIGRKKFFKLDGHGEKMVYIVFAPNFPDDAFVAGDFEEIHPGDFIKLNDKDSIIKSWHYWKTRCQLIEAVHNSYPMGSIFAFQAYHQFLKNNPEPK